MAVLTHDSLCTVPWREPSASKPVSIFPQRLVRRADSPFRFAVAATQRTDLDTVSVRDADFRLRPFSEYARNRRIKAFVVVRNDTILYERYQGGYTESTRSSSFSVAKSITSALLGVEQIGVAVLVRPALSWHILAALRVS